MRMLNSSCRQVLNRYHPGMKSTDLPPEAMQSVKSLSDRLKLAADQGITAGTRITQMIKKLHQGGPSAIAAARQLLESPTGGLIVNARAIDWALEPKISTSVEAFTAQLTLAGYDMPRRLLQNGENPTFVQSLLQLLHQSVMWVQSGLNVFNLTESLTAGLLLTDPTSVTEEVFHLPYSAFVLSVPQGYIPFSYRIDALRWANEIWVHRFDSVARGTVYQITAVCEGVTLFRRDTYVDIINKTHFDNQLICMEDDPEITSDDDKTMSLAIRLVRNFVAWLSTQDLATVPTNRRKKPKSSKSNPQDAIFPTTWFMGRTVKLSKEVRKMAAEASLGLSPVTAKEGWKVRMRHVVRGHWKAQAHGKGRTERKRLWVEPYWRGPQGEEAWVHMYQATV